MRYQFSPPRFVVTLIAFSIVIVALSALVGAAAGIAVPPAVNAVLCIVGTVAAEGWRYAKLERDPPEDALSRRVAARISIWGSAIFLVGNLLGALLVVGPEAMADAAVILPLLGQTAVFAGTFLLVGFFLFRGVARRLILDRQG